MVWNFNPRNMKRLIILFIVFGCSEAKSQVGVIDNQVKTSTYAGSEVYSVPLRAPRLTGSFYLYDDWTVGSIILKNGSVVSEKPMKYNMLNHELIYMDNKQMLGVKLSAVEGFNLFTPAGVFVDFLVNDTWMIDNVLRDGVFQKLSAIEEYGLLKLVELYFIKSNYNIALDAGEKDDRYEKKEELYFLNLSARSLTKVPRGRKKIIQYFQDERLEGFLATNKLDIKSEEGLITLIDFVNNKTPNN